METMDYMEYIIVGGAVFSLTMVVLLVLNFFGIISIAFI
jgi:uncharacterized membrane protein